MSRLFVDGIDVSVRADERGRPKFVEWKIPTWQRCRAEQVVRVCNRWRVDDDWWRVDDDWWREPISRMYYKVLTPTALLELFQDLITGEWRLERVYD